MPAIIAHHLFGTAIQSRLGADAFPTNDELAAFLLGNQGADPFYYYVIPSKGCDAKRLGKEMHTRRAARSLDAMREFARTLTGDDRAIADAYLKGFICHFTLDTQVHPFIVAEQTEICSAGVEGLGPDAARYVHAQIEADLDSALLARITGQTIETWRVHDHVLIADNPVLNVVDKLYRYAAAGVYGTILPVGEFARAVKEARVAAAILHSPTGWSRNLVGGAERLFRPHSIAQALSHRIEVGESSAFDNDGHHPWTNPYTGEVSHASFSDLFEQSQDLALDNIELHANARPSFDICGTMNFLGDPNPKADD